MNNMGMLMQAMKNPQSFLQQAMQNNQMMQNPMLKNAIEMYQRGDREGVNQLAQNLCKEKGTSFEQMAQQIKSQFGM
jgi:hypothetical protein